MILSTVISKMAISDLVQLAQYGKDKLFIDYDEEADDAIQEEDGIIGRKKGKKLVGLTILNASRFKN